MKQYILALDQGTTSSRSILFDAAGAPVASEQQEFRQIYPQPGWVEHDPRDIWESQLATIRRLLQRTGVRAQEIAAIGITNQRETTVLWERATGEPVCNAIVWQCRRTTGLCEQLKAEGLEEEVRRRTGLVIDAYFSGTKLRWMLDHHTGLRQRAERGEICFGTVDSWLLFKLTGEHRTDFSNASRTMLFNIHDLCWDGLLLKAIGVPREVLPEACPTAFEFGHTCLFGADIPVCALVGDQQAALFGQTAFACGQSKNTYGTGCFAVLNTGREAIASTHGLLSSVGWDQGSGPVYVLEGSIFVAGAVIQWLRDEMQLIRTAAESESVAAQVEDTGGVHFVPAFVGLGAPHWDMRARGIITGLTRGTGRAHLVRAALESISYQTAEVLQTMEKDSGEPLKVLRVDGGAAANNLLMQHQADILGIPVERGRVLETTAQGAAYLAGLHVGHWRNVDVLSGLWQQDRIFEPRWSESMRAEQMGAWQAALRRCTSSD